MIMDDDDQTKMKKIDLIQQATTRLRRKQLEEQLCDMMAGLTNIQTQSKHMYDQLSDSMSTTQQLVNYDIEQQHEQMDLLENQIKFHRAILQQWFPLMSSSYDIPRGINDDSKSEYSSNSSNNDNECDNTTNAKTSTMSRLSSLSMISSLFSRPISRSTSISEFTDNMDGRPNLSNLGEQSTAMEQQWNQLYRYQRRLRVKNHRQRYQYRQRINGNSDDRDNVLADFAIASTISPSPTTKTRNYYPGKHQSGSASTPTSTCLASPRYTVSTSAAALSLSPIHPLPSSTIPLPSPPLSPMSFSGACQTPSPHENVYHHDNDDTLSTSSSSQYKFGTDNDKVSNTSEGYLEMDQYQYQRQGTGATFSSSSSMSMQHTSFSDDGAKGWHQYSGHKTLDDDTKDILEQMDAMEKEGYDEFFFQDMAFLLDHPDLCSQPLADLAPLLEQQHHYLEQTSSGDKGSSFSSSSGWTHGPSSGSTTPYIQHLCSSGWQWYRFVSILSVSYMVSLLKGPDDLLVD